ncbi:MAG: hypothetical protein AABZ00_07015 [Chloroflexota bacterium]
MGSSLPDTPRPTISYEAISLTVQGIASPHRPAFGAEKSGSHIVPEWGMTN